MKSKAEQSSVDSESKLYTRSRRGIQHTSLFESTIHQPKSRLHLQTQIPPPSLPYFKTPASFCLCTPRPSPVMKHSRDPKSGCFSTVLRRLLCSGGPQTHPSDHISDPDEENTQLFTTQLSAAPGIVARLMGLDSFPGKVSASEDPARVSRSKSVNFIDYLLEFDVTEARHRRFRTSVSFREVPSRQLQEKHGQELLLIYLENGAGKQSTAGLLKQMKCEKEKVSKKEEKKNNKISKLKDEPRRRRRGGIGKEKNMENRKEEVSGLGRSKRKEVLGWRAECEQTPADDPGHRKPDCKKRWPARRGSSCDSARSVKEETASLVESLGNLSRLTEEDMESRSWRRDMSEVNGEVLEEICGRLEGQILDQVAGELLGILYAGEGRAGPAVGGGAGSLCSALLCSAV